MKITEQCCVRSVKSNICTRKSKSTENFCSYTESHHTVVMLISDVWIDTVKIYRLKWTLWMCFFFIWTVRMAFVTNLSVGHIKCTGFALRMFFLARQCQTTTYIFFISCICYIFFLSDKNNSENNQIFLFWHVIKKKFRFDCRSPRQQNHKLLRFILFIPHAISGLVL